MSPRVTDNATTPSINPLVVEVGLQTLNEGTKLLQPLRKAQPKVSSGKRPLLERRRKRWSRRQW